MTSTDIEYGYIDHDYKKDDGLYGKKTDTAIVEPKPAQKDSWMV